MGDDAYIRWGLEPVYTQIADRLHRKYHFNLKDHIASMNELGRDVQNGFWFTPKDDRLLVAALTATGSFVHDNRADLFHALAASATQGEGYRELSADSSIHCQIGPAAVNMHIDYASFVWRGPDGKTYIGPDAIFHILDELKWKGIVDSVYKKNKFIGLVLQRLHPFVPTTANNFLPQFGITLDLVRGKSFDLSQQWSLTVDFKYGCTGYSCLRTETLTGLNFTYRN
jgi:hypothetical protein